MSKPGEVFTPAEIAARLAAGMPESFGRGPILDPACGEGALLIEVARTRTGDDLFGIEIDPQLAQRAQAKLDELLQLRDGRRNKNRSTILCADALDPQTTWPQGTAVIANPPWVSFSGRQAPGVSRKTRRHGPLTGWPCLHGAFLERIARHVATQATAARIVLPLSVLGQKGYSSLRCLVTSICQIEGVEEIGEDCFPGVVGPAAMLTLRPRDPGEGSTASWILPSDAARAWLAALAEFPRPPRGTFADPGVHTGNAAAELILRGGRAEDADALRSSPSFAPIREGRNLSPFRLTQPKATLRLDLEQTTERRFRVRTLEAYQRFPILIRQTADRPIAALHESPTYFRNSLLAAREVPGLDPGFLTAILNGPVASVWHRLSFADGRQRAFPQVKVGHLQTQPLPFAARSANPSLHDQLADLARALQWQSSRGKPSQDALNRVLLLALRAYNLPRPLEASLHASRFPHDEHHQQRAPRSI